MRKTIIKIKELDENFAFVIERNFKKTFKDVLALASMLDVIKNKQLEEYISEVKRVKDE